MSAFIDFERGRFAVELICRTLGVSASAYYHRASGQRSPRAVVDERLLERIRELHASNYFAYGSRRMWKALRRAGENVGRGRVERLMRAKGIQGAKRRGKPWRTTTPDVEARCRTDLVQRDFTASRPDELWVADLTYLPCWEGRVFFAFIIDVSVARSSAGSSRHMRTTLVLDALRMALAQRAAGATSSSCTTATGEVSTRRSITPRRSPITAFSQASARSGTPTTTAGRELRRLLQDRAGRRPRLAHALTARARRR